MNLRSACVTRSLPENAPDLPAELVLFKVGSNDSTKGPALWDAKAAELTMAKAAERAGVRYNVDLEHRSLDEHARALTKDATDALGYFDLEVRNGDLLAVNIVWTDEGAERLRSRKQVYFSPAFYVDAEGRVIEIINFALTSAPATHGLAPLVAASRTSKSSGFARAWASVVARASRKLARDLQRCTKRARLQK